MNMRRSLSAAVLVCLGLAACENAVFSERGATGFTIADASGVLVTVDGSRVSGSIVLAVGESRTLYASLRGPDGVPVESALDEAVRVTVPDDGLLAWDPGYQGPHTGALHGRAAGSTSLTLELVRRGGQVHASPPIPVVVTP